MSAAENKAVFLSYVSQDAEAARRICDGLRAAGVEGWFDQGGSSTGAGFGRPAFAVRMGREMDSPGHALDHLMVTFSFSP